MHRNYFGELVNISTKFIKRMANHKKSFRALQKDHMQRTRNLRASPSGKQLRSASCMVE